jgi:hypothetical protein
VRRRLYSGAGVDLAVTGRYKSAEEKGKVLPLFADKLYSEENRPHEEA